MCVVKGSHFEGVSKKKKKNNLLLNWYISKDLDFLTFDQKLAPE